VVGEKMSELKEEEIVKKGEELSPQPYLSPSSINTYYSCPFKYFLNYITKIKVKPNIHLIKGGIVHKVLEDFYRGYKPNMEENALKLFEKTWEKYEQKLKDLELPKEQLKVEKEDCRDMIKEHLFVVTRKIGNLIKIGKAENEKHGYYLLKPKFRELYVKSEELKCCGFIDRINEGFDGLITLGDYKTSSKYGIGLPADYKRQLSIYSLLYETQEKKQPDFVSVVFLRYGEEYLLEVTPSLLKYARDIIDYVYPRTRSISKGDYPKKEGNHCRWCQFRNICSGKEDWEKIIRLQNIQKKIEKK
jgi:ATP-dependent helicase/DNAse subunit B